MGIKSLLQLTIFLFISTHIFAQTGHIHGIVKVQGEPIEFAQIQINETSLGATTNVQGKFVIKEVPFGTYEIVSSYIGYKSIRKTITIDYNLSNIEILFDLEEEVFALDDIVITGSKTSKRQTNSAVIVNVINTETLQEVQACNLSEGLKFQPGLRVETDCQTCNYTQLRMNGLAGGYSQILINGRPIFSPLTGLYGLEQLPSNMIDRIEVVRGGGASLYGSSAIGGTVNVITKIPKRNAFVLDYSYHNIDGQTSDNIFNANASLVSESKNSGISFFMNRRIRDFYDANGDNFSEIPLLNTTAIGANYFLLPKENQKLELNLSNVREYRFGGEMRTDVPAFQTLQSEERMHDVWMASADYQINFNNHNSSFISYLAWQNTDRDHYTGIRPDLDDPSFDDFISNPPYGFSEVSTFNVGIQLDHKLSHFLNGSNVLTFGMEYIYDDVLDDIPAYNYLVDQTTSDFGIFLQSDWAILDELSLLSGIRVDKHNLVEQLVISPRASLLYKPIANMQFRFSYGTGFRAPQAFDTDLHIAFAGGGISRVLLSPNLLRERSQSYSASINYDYPMKNWIAGFTLETFHNRLDDVFFLQPIGADYFGELFEKQNGDGATVKGMTLELRANIDRKIQFEGGFTLQSSRFDNVVQYIDELAGIREFIRTPNDYGYAIITYTANKKWTSSINYVYTGSMVVPHFAGAPNQLADNLFTTNSFSELNTRLSYTFSLDRIGNKLELYGGVKNVFNSYQDDFDLGKNRDSNYIYGTAQPRTFFVGVKLLSI